MSNQNISHSYYYQYLTEMLNQAYDSLTNYHNNVYMIENDNSGLSEYICEYIYNIYSIYIPQTQTQIEYLENQLQSIKRMEIIKNELIDKSNRMMYHPKRIKKLLDLGLISFYSPESFQNL
jgi:hypothetical protein